MTPEQPCLDRLILPVLLLQKVKLAVDREKNEVSLVYSHTAWHLVKTMNCPIDQWIVV